MRISINANEILMAAAVDVARDIMEHYEGVLDVVIDEANRRMGEANAHIQELGSVIEDDEEVIDVLLDDVIALTKELQEVKARNEELEAMVEIMPVALSLGLSVSEVVDVVHRVIENSKLPAGYAKEFHGYPTCCAEGHCGTSKCGGDCNNAPFIGIDFAVDTSEALNEAPEEVVNAFRFLFMD